MEPIDKGAFGVLKVQDLLCGSKDLFHLLCLTLFVKQRVELEVMLEDWVRRAIH